MAGRTPVSSCLSRATFAALAVFAGSSAAHGAPAVSASGHASAEVVVPVEILYSLGKPGTNQPALNAASQSICRPLRAPCPIHFDTVVVIIDEKDTRRPRSGAAASPRVLVYFE